MSFADNTVWRYKSDTEVVPKSSGVMQVEIPDGTATDPSLTFGSVPQTGMYLWASNVIGFSSNEIPSVNIGGESARYINIAPTNRTMTTLYALVDVISDYTLDFYQALAPVGYYYQPTLTFAQDGFGFISGTLFVSLPYIQNDSGSTRSVGPFVTFASSPTYRANGGTVTLGSDVSMATNPTFITINGGACNVTNSYGYWAQGVTVGSGATVTNYVGHYQDFVPTSVSGTLTNVTGYQTTPFTVGTNRYGVVIGTPTNDGAPTTRRTLWLSYNADNTTDVGGIIFGASADTNLYRSAANTLKTNDTFDANAYSVAGTAGASGTFTTADAKTVTVTNGIITNIV